MGILPSKKDSAESIYSTIDWLALKKNVQYHKLAGMGFDGAAMFAGTKSVVQARIKMNALHAILIHCHCHRLQLALFQAVNSPQGIKHIYTPLTTLWKFFYRIPKKCKCFKEVQKLLALPQVENSETIWH